MVPGVPHASDERFLVAHGLRIKGLAASSELAAWVTMSGAEATDVVSHLDALRGRGLARRREGAVTGWSLTAAGRAAHADACAKDLASAGCAHALEDGYLCFLRTNRPFLQVCTDWQLVTGSEALNEHADPDYDAAVLARLAALHAIVEPIVDDLASAMSRFAGYRPRLSSSLGQVQSGGRDWFTGAMMQSYHTVWCELHEDLLATLGIERSKEAT